MTTTKILLQKPLNPKDDNISALQQIKLLTQFLKRVNNMASGEYVERTATSIAVLGRNELKKRIKNFKGRFRMDFTEDYLNRTSVDRLRHILLAALINARPHN